MNIEDIVFGKRCVDTFTGKTGLIVGVSRSFQTSAICILSDKDSKKSWDNIIYMELVDDEIDSSFMRKDLNTINDFLDNKFNLGDAVCDIYSGYSGKVTDIVILCTGDISYLVTEEYISNKKLLENDGFYEAWFDESRLKSI